VRLREGTNEEDLDTSQWQQPGCCEVPLCEPEAPLLTNISVGASEIWRMQGMRELVKSAIHFHCTVRLTVAVLLAIFGSVVSAMDRVFCYHCA
jgi:hypothetical protein